MVEVWETPDPEPAQRRQQVPAPAWEQQPAVAEEELEVWLALAVAAGLEGQLAPVAWGLRPQ